MIMEMIQIDMKIWRSWIFLKTIEKKLDHSFIAPLRTCLLWISLCTLWKFYFTSHFTFSRFHVFLFWFALFSHWISYLSWNQSFIFSAVEANSHTADLHEYKLKKQIDAELLNKTNKCVRGKDKRRILSNSWKKFYASGQHWEIARRQINSGLMDWLKNYTSKLSQENFFLGGFSNLNRGSS